MDSEVSILKQEDLERLYDLTEALVGEIRESRCRQAHRGYTARHSAACRWACAYRRRARCGQNYARGSIGARSGLKFRRAQFTPDVMASDITGFNIYNRRTERFEV